MLYKINIEKTFLLTSLPFVGYLIAYFYQYGFLQRYNLPSIFIKVTIESILTPSISIAGIYLFILLGFWVMNTHIRTFLDKHFFKYINTGKRAYLMCFISLLFFCFLYEIFKSKIIASLFIPIIIIFGVGTILMTILLITYFLIYIFKKKNFKEAIKRFTFEFNKKTKNTSSNSFPFTVNFLFKIPYFSYILYSIFIFLLILTSILFGYSEASTKTQYLLYKDKSNTYAIVSNYNDQFLGLQLDKTQHHVTNYVKIIENGDDTFSVKNNMQLDIPQQNLILEAIYYKIIEN